MGLLKRVFVCFVFFVTLFGFFSLSSSKTYAVWDCVVNSSCIGGRSTCDRDYGPLYSCQNLVCGSVGNPSCVGQCCIWVPDAPTPTPFPFDCSDQGGLQFACFSGGCPRDWVQSNQSPTTCSVGYSCCWYNPPPATSTPVPGVPNTPTPRVGVCTNGTTRYDCSPAAVASCSVDACVGIPQLCQNGAWVVTNSAGECTTACTNCTHIGDPTATPTSTPIDTPVPPPPGTTATPTPTPTATPTPLPAPRLSFSCSGDPGVLTASWPPVVGASTYAIRIDDKANACLHPVA